MGYGPVSGLYVYPMGTPVFHNLTQ
eukprot:SAG11_NODE_2247_length_3636_cov_3.037037_6_plen_24_part_01